MKRRVLACVIVGACFLLVGSLSGVALALPSSEPFEIVPGSFHVVPSTTQAGAHEDLVTSFDFAHTAAGRTHNDVKDTIVNVPPGFVGSNTAAPTCTDAQLLSEQFNTNVEGCPIASQIGTISFELTGGELTGRFGNQFVIAPLYNMETTSFGIAAELGFNPEFITQVLPISIRPDLGLTVTSPSIIEFSEPRDISADVWGVPATHAHDLHRHLFFATSGGWECTHAAEKTDECHTTATANSPATEGYEAGIPPKPFLANPTSCGPTVATMEANSWEHPEEWSKASTEVAPIEGCERVPFDSSVEAHTTTEAAESSTGLNFTINVPQSWGNPETLATANLKDAKVVLPEGVTINPSAGSGLGACTPAQYAAETSSSLPGAACPEESKIGSVEIETPLLAEKIEGAVYVATPFDNPFSEPGHPNGSLLALYVVAKDPNRGVLVKVAGKLELDPVTGRITTTFNENPQQPFSRFTVKFRPGATAPLVSPPLCGSYAAQVELTPWSAPLQQFLFSSAPFTVTRGVREGACPTGGVAPFKPQVISGTQNNAGGSYSPFYLRIVREDGEQELTKFTTILPSGLSGNLTGIPFCPDSAIEASRSATGQQELTDPSCPATSEIGHTIVGAGVGAVLAQTPGKVYLAGPYHGSALSIVSITSATVGPFDLGTVVIRFGLRINPITAQVEVDSATSDPIPHIIDGVVVHVRDIRVYMNRPDFTLNPTNCSPMSVLETITGAGADPSSTADDVSVNETAPFQAADCASLAFKPSFKASTSGKTSRADGASLSVKLTYPKAAPGSQSNIRSVKVDLPKQLPSELKTLQKACPDKVFEANPAECPAASKVGSAKALTPILPVPLEGPAYFVSHGGAKFPELIVVLQGYGFTIDLHGETFISKSGITSSTFRTVPDQPVTSFELNLPQGRYSALAANGNLCSVTHTVTQRKKVTVKLHGQKHTITKTIHKNISGTLTMPTVFTAQNGIVIHQSTVISVTGCPTAHKKTNKHNSNGKKK